VKWSIPGNEQAIQERMWQQVQEQSRRATTEMLNRMMEAERTAYPACRPLLDAGYKPTRPKTTFAQTT